MATIVHQSTQPRHPDRVVLFGGSGFIGTSIRRQLQSIACPVVSLSSIDVDLADPAAPDKLSMLLRPSDAVVMLAALTPDKGRDIATFMKNLAMMQSVCAAVVKCGCAHFIYFSSDAVYDPAESRVSEDTAANAQDLYGAMHLVRETMVRSLVNVPTLILRPTLVYGAGDTHNSYGPNRFRRAAQKDGRILLFGNGEDSRDHIHVADVAILTARCLLHRSTGLLNVVTGTSKSFREVAELVGRSFGQHIRIVTTPRRVESSHRHYDVTNMIKAFPDFCCVALEGGLQNMPKTGPSMLETGSIL